MDVLVRLARKDEGEGIKADRECGVVASGAVSGVFGGRLRRAANRRIFQLKFAT